MVRFIAGLFFTILAGQTNAFVAPPRPSFRTQIYQSFAETALSISSVAGSLRGKTIVVKYGGNAMTSPELARGFCEDVAALQKLGIRVVVVHGGGPQISSMLEKLGVETRFEGGMRVSSAEVVEVAEMILCGSVNKGIASSICAAGGRAIGLSGRDDSLLQCTKQANKDGFDLGFVGKVETVNTAMLESILALGITPVVSPIGTGIGGELKAYRVLFLTDIAGVLDKEKNLLRTLTVKKIEDLIDDETITGGMIPKVTFATSAVQLGVQEALITDGRVPHALLNQVLGSIDSEGGTIVTL
jgi:acetylglutamate kinase